MAQKFDSPVADIVAFDDIFIDYEPCDEPDPSPARRAKSDPDDDVDSDVDPNDSYYDDRDPDSFPDDDRDDDNR